MEKNRFRFKWWALLGVSVLAFTAFLDATIVNTALPFIQTAFKANILQLQWIANIFTIVLSMTMIAIGKLADLWGRRRLFYTGVTIFAIAALGAGLSSSIPALVFFRGLQALGASTLFVSSTALLSHVFPASERGRAISIYAGVTGCGLMIGPFLGGILIGLLGWRWVFWVNLPLIVVGLGACSFSLTRPTFTKSPKPLDRIGLAFLIVGLGSLLYGIITGAETGWSSILGWVSLGIGALMLAILIFIDLRRRDSLLDLSIFKDKLIILAALSCSLAGVISTVFMFFDPLYLRILRHLCPFHIGLLIAIIPAAQVVISFVFNQLEKRWGTSRLLFISTALAFCAVFLHRFLQAETPLLFLALPFFLLGINWGLSNAATITAVNQRVAPHETGAALGTIMTVWNIAGSLILALSTAVFHSVPEKGGFLPAFHAAIDFNILFAALILVLASIFRGGRWPNRRPA
jgi:EmrB/QacA subfamily drug resistance transporter